MFCPKCGSILMPKKEGNKTVLQCTCGYREVKEEGVKFTEKKEIEEKEVEVVHEVKETLPVTKEDCPKCGNPEAYYELQQTRSADEPPTKFLRCTKCKHTWRDYD